MASSEDLDFEPFVRAPTAGGGKRVPAPTVTRSALGHGFPASPTIGSAGATLVPGSPLRKASLPASPDIPSIPNVDSDTDSNDVHQSPAPDTKSSRSSRHTTVSSSTAKTTTVLPISKPRAMARMTPYGGAANAAQKQNKKGGGGGVLSVITGSLGSSKRRASSGSSSTYRPSTLSKPVVGLASVGPRGGDVPAMAKRRSRSAPPKGLPTISTRPDNSALGDLQEGSAAGPEQTSASLALPAVLEMLRSVSGHGQAATAVTVTTTTASAGGGGGDGGEGVEITAIEVGPVRGPGRGWKCGARNTPAARDAGRHTAAAGSMQATWAAAERRTAVGVPGEGRPARADGTAARSTRLESPPVPAVPASLNSGHC